MTNSRTSFMLIVYRLQNKETQGISFYFSFNLFFFFSLFFFCHLAEGDRDWLGLGLEVALALALGQQQFLQAAAVGLRLRQ